VQAVRDKNQEGTFKNILFSIVDRPTFEARPNFKSPTRDIIWRSVLGPLVFTIYTRPLRIIAQRYGVKYYLYADDTHLYISLYPDNELNFSSSLKNLKHCIVDIRLWMTQNLLKLNGNKTNIMYLASSHCVKSLKTPALQMGASSITPVLLIWRSGHPVRYYCRCQGIGSSRILIVHLVLQL